MGRIQSERLPHSLNPQQLSEGTSRVARDVWRPARRKTRNSGRIYISTYTLAALRPVTKIATNLWPSSAAGKTCLGSVARALATPILLLDACRDDAR